MSSEKGGRNEHRETAGLEQAILDSLTAHCCILQRDGTIVAVNRAWRDFAAAHHAACNSVCEGANYLSVCCGAEGPDAELAMEFIEGFHKTLSGESDSFELEYPCHSPEEERWFLCRATKLEGLDADRIVVFHENITPRKQAEAAKQTSECYLQCLLNSMPDIILRFDAEGRHLYASDNIEPYTGIPSDRFIDKTHRELGFPDDMCEFWERAIRQVFESSETMECDFSYQGPEGEVIFNWRLVPELDTQGNVASVLSVSRDITEQRHLKSDYELLFGEMLDGFALHEMITDADGTPVDYRFLAVNPAFEKITGLQARDIIGRTVLEVMPDIERSWIARYGQVAMTGEPAYFENYSQDIDKHFQVAAFRPAPGRFACIFADITERKATEKQLIFQSMILDQIKDQVTVTDLNGIILYVNEAEVKMLDRPRDQILGRHVDIYGEDASRGATQKEIIETTLAQGSWRGEIVNYASDGGERIMECRTSLVHDADGQPIAMCGVSSDITERKRQEHERQQLEMQYRQAQKMEAIGRLAAGVAHDFNNQLTVIQGYSEMILNDHADDSVRDNALQIHRAARRAHATTSHLLSFSRKQQLTAEAFDLKQMLCDLQKPLSRIIGEDIRLAMEIPPALPPVFMDCAGLQQAMMNLIVNARDAMPSGGRLVVRAGRYSHSSRNASVFSDAPPGDYVLLEIIDAGIGMDAETLEHAFDPFYTTKEPGKGTGLGLPMVMGFILQSNGYMHLDSAVDRGTTVRLLLPQAKGEISLPASQNAHEENASTPGKTLMVVEDEIAVRLLLVDILQQAGYHVLVAPGPREAIEVFNDHRDDIDMIITDMIMPDMRGDEFARIVRRSRDRLPILYVTGYCDAVLSADMEVLHKPFKTADLLQRIKTIFEEH